MNLPRSLYPVTFTLLLAPVLLAACGDDDSGGATPTATAERTAGPTQAGTLPEGYPPDFPAYEHTSVEQALQLEGQVIVIMSSPDSRSAVASFYREELQKAPWELVSEADSPVQNMLLLNFRHTEDPVRGSVTINTSGDSTIVSLRFVLTGSPAATDTASETPG